MNINITDPIEYGKVGDRPLLAVLYRPQTDSTDPLPTILWIHGGAWWAGARHDDANLCRAIAEAGFVCLSIDYRLSQEAIFPAAIQDCHCAVRYLRAHAAELGIAPDRIGAWGPSAGGHLAALLGVSAHVADFTNGGGWPGVSSAVQAVCDWFGPTDFLQMSAHPSDMDHDAPDSPESQFIGGPITAHTDRVRQANPITYLSDSTPPLLIAHGTQDRLVPFNQSELLYAAMLAQGLNVTFERLENAGHGGAGFEADSPLFARCIVFFRQHLAQPVL